MRDVRRYYLGAFAVMDQPAHRLANQNLVPDAIEGLPAGRLVGVLPLDQNQSKGVIASRFTQGRPPSGPLSPPLLSGYLGRQHAL